MITLNLTEQEYKELRFIVRTMTDWGSGGGYGDSENITDKKGYATAKRLLKKVESLTR